MSVAALPRPSVLPALGGARAGVRAAAEVPLELVAEEELATALEQVVALEAQAAAVRLAVLAEAERRGVADAAAATGTDAWAAELTGDRREVMRGGLLLARELGSTCHHTREALAAGRVNLSQVRIIVEACRQAPEEATPEQVAAAEGYMVARASGEATRTGRPMTPRRLRQVVRRMFDPIDRELADRHEAIMLGRQRRRAEAETFLQVGDDGDGSFSGRFRIPELHGHLLVQALQRLSAPRRLVRDAAGRPMVDETATPCGTLEAHGHAFCELLEHLPATGHATNGTTVLVTVDLEHLTRQLPDHLLPDRVEVGAGRLDLGVRVPAGEVRRLACEAGIVPVVMGGASVPLDLGRERRLHTRAQRHALTTHHETCAASGCERPFAWCEIHHPHPWSRGGTTDLDNALPLCGHHHRRAHDPAWRLCRHPDGSWRFHPRP